MPEVLSKDEFHEHKQRLLQELQHSVFIYPTDTIYGIGCDARDAALVRRVRHIKQRQETPFSVIAPSKGWIREHCVVTAEAERWLAKLPGPYTLVLRLVGSPLPREVNGGLATIGVRIPAHWISDVVAELRMPLVTTSANLTGESYMTSLDDLNPDMRKSVDHIVYEGPIKGRPSTIVRLDKDETELRERGVNG